MTTIIITMSAVLIVAAIVWLNVEDHRRRAAMTPEERLADDEETNLEMQIW